MYKVTYVLNVSIAVIHNGQNHHMAVWPAN